MLFIIQTQGTIEKNLPAFIRFISFIFFVVKKCVHTDKNDPTSQ